jgi:hypothetical protein
MIKQGEGVMKNINYMKTVSLLGLVAIFLLYSDFAFGQGKKDDSTAKLIQRIESLEKKIQDQEKQIETLQDDLNKMKKESPMVTIPPLGSNLKGFSKELPYGATPFKFNGQIYYMVPLNKLTGENKGLNKYK